MPTATHYLKTWPGFFIQVYEGCKPFELRKNDRDFRVDDFIVLLEWDPARAKEAEREAAGYTGREIRGTITSIVTDDTMIGAEGLKPGYAILGCHWSSGLKTTVR
jgi:hypothetical protein